jgi:uncharacterized protein with GYD domain
LTEQVKKFHPSPETAEITMKTLESLGGIFKELFATMGAMGIINESTKPCTEVAAFSVANLAMILSTSRARGANEYKDATSKENLLFAGILAANCAIFNAGHQSRFPTEDDGTGNQVANVFEQSLKDFEHLTGKNWLDEEQLKQQAS